MALSAMIPRMLFTLHSIPRQQSAHIFVSSQRTRDSSPRLSAALLSSAYTPSPFALASLSHFPLFPRSERDFFSFSYSRYSRLFLLSSSSSSSSSSFDNRSRSTSLDLSTRALLDRRGITRRTNPTIGQTINAFERLSTIRGKEILWCRWGGNEERVYYARGWFSVGPARIERNRTERGERREQRENDIRQRERRAEQGGLTRRRKHKDSSEWKGCVEGGVKRLTVCYHGNATPLRQEEPESSLLQSP